MCGHSFIHSFNKRINTICSKNIANALKHIRSFFIHSANWLQSNRAGLVEGEGVELLLGTEARVSVLKAV